MRRLAVTPVLLCLVTFFLLFVGPMAAGEPAMGPALQEARDLFIDGRFERAAKAFRKANASAGGACYPCLLGLLEAHDRLGNVKKAVAAGREAADLAQEVGDKARAFDAVGKAYLNHYARGLARAAQQPVTLEITPVALLGSGRSQFSVRVPGSDLPPFLDKAEAAFRQALAAWPGSSDPAPSAGSNREATALALASVLVEQMRGREDQSAWTEVFALLRGIRGKTPEALDAGWILSLSSSGKDGLAQEDLVPVGGVVPAPKRLSGPPPYYTELGRSRRFEGLTKVRVRIGVEGEVGILEVVQPAPYGLTERALRAIAQWRYAPTVIDGEPVAVSHLLTLRYTLQGK